MREKINIVFATPFYGYSGSEIALYNLLNNWPAGYNLNMITIENGSLSEKTKPEIQIFYFGDYTKNQNKFFKKLNREVLKGGKTTNTVERYVSYVQQRTSPKLWVLNTLIMTQYLKYLMKLNARVVLFAHEMDWTFSHFNREQLMQMVDYPELIICCSEASAAGFRKLGRKDRLQIVYPGVDFESIHITKQKAEVFADLGIMCETILIGMSGSLDKNKDPMMFVEVAKKLLQKNSNYFFIWIGGNRDSGDLFYANRIAMDYGIDNKIKFLGYQKEDYYNYLNALDAFFLTSVYDSFPLVMIESGFLKKPVIGFDSGGIREFITEDTGFIISERSAELAANLIDDYLSKLDKTFNETASFNNALKYSALNSAINFESQLRNL